MPGLITKNFRIHNTKQFIEQFSEESPSVLYFFIGRSVSWADDTSPPALIETQTELADKTWAEMLSLKRITSADVSFGVDRVDWRTNTVYTQYSSSVEYQEGDYYVVTDQFDVYICLSNNNGAPSTQRPTGRLLEPIQTSDGYIWKYLLSISAPDALNFMTSTYMPIRQLASNDGSTQWAVQQAAIRGTIDTIKVTSGGTSYIEHTGTLSSAPNSTNVILAATASAGDDTYNRMGIYILSGTGTGQLREISDYVGSSRTAIVSSPFSPALDASSGYVIGPLVSIVGTGTNARAYSRVTGGAISRVVLVANGSGYTSATATAVSGVGTGAVLTPSLSPFTGHGAAAIYDLLAHNVIMNVRLIGTENNKFVFSNDFRTVGIVADPLRADGVAATGVAYDQTLRVTVNTPYLRFSKDEQVRNPSGATANVVEYLSPTVVRLTNVRGKFTNGETITGQTSTANAKITSQAAPDLTPYRGDVLYQEYRTPTTRTELQTEEVKILIRF